MSQGPVKLNARACELKNLLPHFRLNFNNFDEVFNVEGCQLLHLGEDDSVEDLLRGRQHRDGAVEVAEDHPSPRPKHLLIILGPPIPGEPLQVLFIQQFKLVFFNYFVLGLPLPLLRLRSLSLIFEGSLNPDDHNTVILIKQFRGHRVKFDDCNSVFYHEFEGARALYSLFLPCSPARLKDHAMEALKLHPHTRHFLVHPGPVKVLETVEDQQIVRNVPLVQKMNHFVTKIRIDPLPFLSTNIELLRRLSTYLRHIQPLEVRTQRRYPVLCLL